MESPGPWHLHTADSADKLGLFTATKLGCLCHSSEETLSCMRGLKSDQIKEALNNTSLAIYFIPIVDGEMIPDQPGSLFQKGKE